MVWQINYLSARYNIIFRVFWGLIHYDASHGIPVEASDGSENMVIPLDNLDV